MMVRRGRGRFSWEASLRSERQAVTGVGLLVVGDGTDEPFTGIRGYVSLLIEQHLGEG